MRTSPGSKNRGLCTPIPMPPTHGPQPVFPQNPLTMSAIPLEIYREIYLAQQGLSRSFFVGSGRSLGFAYPFRELSGCGTHARGASWRPLAFWRRRELLLVDGNLDDLFLDCVGNQLGFVMNIELAHEVELVCFHGLHAQAQDHG